jgi:Protein of unknown function (DUF1353)
MKKLLLLLASTVMFASAQGADDGQFEGKVVVEWMDDPFVSTMRLTEEFGYREAKGRLWKVPAGQVLDGKGLPPLFRALIGQPFDGGFRKSAVVYDFSAHKMTERWDAAQRMFYEASVTEGVLPQDAKAMYLVLATQGSRWEIPGSRCFGSCHGSTAPLEWRPVVDERKVNNLLSWVRASDPTLEEIDKRALTAIRAYGPHIFTQPECDMFSGSTKIRKSCN